MDERENNLVTGPVMPAVFKLALPMLISSVLQNLQTLIDLYWVGHLGSESLAALAISGTVMMVMFPLIMGACSGTVAIVSRAIGAGNAGEAEQAAGESWRLSLFLGLITGVFGCLSTDWLAKLVGAEGNVAVLCYQYLQILFAGCFTAFLLFAGNCILQGAGNTIVPMIVMILSNVINIFLDPVLIFGDYGIPAMGIRGAAIATVISQFVSAVMIFYLLKRGREGIKMRIMAPDISMIKRLLKVGIPGTGQMLSRSLMALVLMRIVTDLGVAETAAYGTGLRLMLILLLPSFAIGSAVSTMVGQNLGAGLPGRAARVTWYSAFADAGFMLLAAMIMWITGGWIAERFSDVDEVIRLSTELLRIVSPFYAFVAIAVVMQRAMMGAGDTVSPFWATVVCLWGLQVPLAVILPKYFETPLHGVCWAMSIAFTVHGIMAALIFAAGGWKNKQV